VISIDTIPVVGTIAQRAPDTHDFNSKGRLPVLFWAGGKEIYVWQTDFLV
jgi:hypothetical protein